MSEEVLDLGTRISRISLFSERADRKHLLSLAQRTNIFETFSSAKHCGRHLGKYYKPCRSLLGLALVKYLVFVLVPDIELLSLGIS